MENRYRLTGRLETGELAELYRAVTDEHDDVVVKLFHQKTTDPRYARSIAETARVLNPLRTEGIIHYLECGLYKGRLAVVREFVDGYLLGQVLQRLNTKEVLLSPEMALYVVILLAETVHKAHEAGVIHGAITPGNVLLSKFGDPSVCDFGALQALQSVPALKKNFGPRGRNSYRAPEISLGDEPSVQSDIYSLGALAYELLTLREAASSKGTAAVSTRREQVPAPSRLDRRINSRLDPIVLRALDPTPQRRFRTCADFAMALRNFLSVNGGVPTMRDLEGFVADLFPKDAQKESLGPVPFGEMFELAEVEGADLPGLNEKSIVVAVRPSYSGGEVDPTAETMHEAPVWEDPESSGANRPDEEPNFDDGTDPSHAGPLEGGWVAPPAAGAPQRAKAGGAAVAGRAAMRAPKVKVIEDFSVVEPSARGVERNTGSTPPRAKKAAAYALPPSNDTIEMPRAPTMSGASQRGPGPVNTAEVRLWNDGLRRRKLLLIAGSVALAGLGIFAIAVGMKGTKRPLPPIPASEMTPIAPAPEHPAASVAPEPEPEVEWYVPPRISRQTGFLNVTANRSAIVYIDGKRVRKQTPLSRVPVLAGMRKVTVESIGTQEKYSELLTVDAGELSAVRGEFKER